MKAITKFIYLASAKDRRCPIALIWPHRLELVPLPEPSLHWRRRRLPTRRTAQHTSGLRSTADHDDLVTISTTNFR